MKISKINYNKWGANYSTPHIGIIVNRTSYGAISDVGIHFVVLNFHWWISINTKHYKY